MENKGEGRTISLKAATNPYHCASNFFLPTAIVSGSANVASSFHSCSFFKLGWPANKSNTLPTSNFWCGVRDTPGAVSMDVFLIPSSLMLVWDASVSLAEMGVVLVEKWFWVAAEVMPPVVSGCVAGWLVEGLLLGMPVDILRGGCEFRV